MRKHSIWLTGVVLLTIAAFLFVFRPFTFSPRKDPKDASRFLRPVGVANWTPKSESPTTTLFGDKVKLYVYKPQHDLNLGLDLQGGMRVVLEISNRAEFEYKLTKELTSNSDISEAKAKLTDAVRTALGDAGKDAEVELNGSDAYVTTYAKDESEAKTQLGLVNDAMTKVFNADGYEMTKKSKKDFFHPAKEAQDQIRSILEKRVNPEGMREVVSYPKGENQVVLEIPGERDPERINEILGTPGELNFMLLAPNIQVNQDEDGNIALIDAMGNQLSDEDALKSAILVLRGRDLNPTSQPDFDSSGKIAVSFSIKGKENQDRFAAWTGGNINRYLAIVLDGKVQSAPTIQARISNNGIITGNYTKEEAQDLSTLLNAGALPMKVKIVESRTVSATLGADSVALSLKAGIIGLLAVLIFMIAYYRLPGIMASIALIIYVVLSLAVLKFFNATLTLPGVAGIIISIGMAVDANVIIFERLKEELRTQKPLDSAIDVAFARAWTAILDSNVASLITGFVLYMLGTGTVRGFAVTLVIGVAVSMFTAITITRLFMKLMIRSKAGHKLAWYGV